MSLEAEQDRYALHDNTREHPGYLRFQNELVREVEAIRPRVNTILDFGCGEHAVLSQLLNEKVFTCVGYDPLYRPMNLVGTYDLVILSEVIEHLRDIRAAVFQVHSNLAPAGKVLVRTRLYPSITSLTDWWYARDPTHINFFCINALAAAARLAERSTVQRLTEDMFLWV